MYGCITNIELPCTNTDYFSYEYMNLKNNYKVASDKLKLSKQVGLRELTIVLLYQQCITMDCTVSIMFIYLLIIHTKLTIEGNAQYILTTQHNIKAKALNATHGSKLNC